MPKVLMVEDEDGLHSLYKTELEERGFTVIRNSTGKDVIGTVKSSKPDIILLDIMLPEKSGLEILTELKGDSDAKKIPVMMLTNYGKDENVKKALEDGAEDFILKYRIVPEEVGKKISAHLGKKGGGKKAK